jgi:hypothetical protein
LEWTDHHLLHQISEEPQQFSAKNRILENFCFFFWNIVQQTRIVHILDCVGMATVSWSNTIMDPQQIQQLPMAEKLVRLDKVKRQLFPPQQGQNVTPFSPTPDSELQNLEEEFLSQYTIISPINKE